MDVPSTIENRASMTTIEHEKDNVTDSQSYIDDDYMITISTVIPSLEECYQFVAADPCCGAISTFIGITRNHFHNKTVLSLVYEAYIPMAMKELLQLCHECKSSTKYPSVRRIAAVHIIGECPIGHASVILACSSPHRIDAIQCCEYLINQLKARIPIWKKEIYINDPNAVWKENIEWFQPPPPPSSSQAEDEAEATTNQPATNLMTDALPPSGLQSRRVMVRQEDANE